MAGDMTNDGIFESHQFVLLEFEINSSVILITNPSERRVLSTAVHITQANVKCVPVCADVQVSVTANVCVCVCVGGRVSGVHAPLAAIFVHLLHPI